MKFVFIAAIIALLIFGSQHFLASSTDASACTEEPLPYCAQLDRMGSHVKVTNDCEFDISIVDTRPSRASNPYLGYLANTPAMLR